MDVVWIVAGIAALGMAVWAWLETRKLGSDEIFAGLTPGLTPASGSVETRELVKGGQYTGEVAVAFNPPRGVRAGLAGTIVDGVPETRDVIATLVDLAAGGFLTITVVETNTNRSGRDWELTAVPGARLAGLEPAERELLQEVFSDGSPVALSHLPRSGNRAFNNHQFALLGEANERNWFRLTGGTQPVRWVWIAAGLLLLGGLWAGSGIALAAGGLTALAALFISSTSGQRLPRTAEGTAAQIQSLGFKKYLATAEKEQFSYEEAAGIFSKYLPYAIVFGVAAHWTKVFGDLAAQAREEGMYNDSFDLVWLGVMGWGLADSMIGVDMLAGSFDGIGAGFEGMFDTGALDSIGADASGMADSFVSGDAGGGDLGGGADFGGGDFGGGFGD